jgi:hypothetical protein
VKNASSVVLASLKPSTYIKPYAFGFSLAAALLEVVFDDPA